MSEHYESGSASGCGMWTALLAALVFWCAVGVAMLWLAFR